MLTCDAFGVLPAVSHLSLEEAHEQFLLGYTAKVAGTEVGVSEPTATFSPCFGAPFMPLVPKVYADLLVEKIKDSGADCWLVNTGWFGGRPGTGHRIPLSVTRNIIDQIVQGRLKDCKFSRENLSEMNVPIDSDTPKEYIVPEHSWDKIEEYRAALNKFNLLVSKQKNK